MIFLKKTWDLLSGSTETKHCRGMKAVMGLLLMLVRVSLGVETSCDGRQDKTQCYAALGGTLVLQLMDKVPEKLTFKWWNSNVLILNRIGNGPVINRLSTRSEFISHNGTLRMNSLSRTDGGEYRLEIFNEDGVITAVRTQQLNIQAPVSTVRLTSACLSQGEKRMSCSSVGDSPQYSWTLDGDTLTDDQLLSGNNETNEIILKQTVSGRLVCLVRNHVSEASVTEMISTCGVETSCDGRQDKTQCYGALGGTLVLQLMDKVPEILTFKWWNSNGIILSRIGNGPVMNKLSTRSEFISHNGTLRMNSLSRTDGGEYKLEIFNEDGEITAVQTQQLNIQAPVSTVRLTSECLSQGEKRMSCSSDGDSPQYSWTLDGDTLTDDQLLSVNNETNEIILKQTVSGRLVCLVRNHVSEASVTEMISTCGPTTLMVTGIVLSLLLIGLMAAFVMVCAHKRRESSNARGGNDQELQYADVKRQQPSRDVQPQAEMGGYGQITFSAQTDKPPAGRGAVQRGQEVEYGEIKFAERPQQKNRLMGPSGSPQGAPQVEYGEIKFIERPRRAR